MSKAQPNDPVAHLRAALTESGPSPEAQAAFAQDVQELLRRRLFALAAVFCVIHVVAYAVALSTSRMLSGAVPWDRIALLGFTLVLLAVASRPGLVRLALVGSVALVLGTAAYLCSFLPRFGLPAHDLPGFTLLLVTAGLLFPYTGRQMLVIAGAVFAGYLTVALVVMQPGQGPHLVRGLFWFVTATLVAVVGARLSDRSRQGEFFARLRAEREREKTEQILRNILPGPIVERLKGQAGAIADAHPETTILFADIVGFTDMSSRLEPDRVVALLDDLFSEFDRITAEHGLEKIKTIGDAYMVAGGVPEHREDHADAVARLALDMRQVVDRFETPTGDALNIRIGINTGPTVAGVIGTRKFLYDLWGDAVNTASRMESYAEPGTIQLTAETAERLSGKFDVERRGELEVKGKGIMDTYLLRGLKAL